MFPWEDKPLRVAATGWHAAACPSPATSPAHSPVPSVGRGGEGEAASVGTSGRPPLQEQRGRLQEGPGPGGSPSPVCSWGRGGSRGLRGREHPGVRCLALAQGATGIGAATEREYRARGAGGTAQELSCRLPRAAPPRSAPAARGEPQWVWTGRPQRTCAGLAWALCSVAPPRGSWPLGGWTERAAPSGRTGTVGGGGRPSRSSSPRLAVACFQAAADWSPVASTTPTPSSGPEGLPSTRGAFTENGPAPWALSPGSPLGDRPASKTPEEARPGQCAKNQHLRSCARMDQRSGASRGMVPAGPSRGSGNPAPPLCRWWRGEPEPDPPEPQRLHALP